ncbi:MAG: acyltransferase family protein [Terriglobia bacterium]
MATLALAKPASVFPKVKSVKHIPALDGLRGAAILAVFFYHYGTGGIHSASTAVRVVATLCGFGWSGVDLFFVLSGFLITGILYDTQHHPSYYRKFYARRTLRIFPIYYLFAAIVLLIFPFAVWHKGDLFFLVYVGYPAALIWPTILNLPVRITHLWSLSVEEQFYMLWPWLIRKLRVPRNILTFCALVGAGSLAFRIAFPVWAYGSLPARMDDLALGAALAVLVRSDLRKRCEKFAFPLFAASAAGVILICAIRHTTDHADRLICTVGFSVIAVAYGSLLLLSLGPLAGLFSLPPLRIFGKYSYGMYLYHFPLTAVSERLKPFFAPIPLGSLVYVAVCLAANLAIAALSFHLFEQPILRLKKRFEYWDKSPSEPRTLERASGPQSPTSYGAKTMGLDGEFICGIVGPRGEE